MKKRLIVMNGQKLLQNDSSGEWKTEKFTKAGDIKPGIYNLYNAVGANKSKDNIGEVIHIDIKENVLYQNNNKQYIKHDLNNFDQDKIPVTGIMINIKYDENSRASIADIPKNLKQGLKM